MFFDIHAHVYRKPVPFVVPFCNPDELLRVYDKYDIEKKFDWKEYINAVGQYFDAIRL